MDPSIAETWTELLSTQQRDQLLWLKDHRCNVEASFAHADPLNDLPPGLVLEALVNKHGVVKLRGTDVPLMFDSLYRSARVLFEFVSEYDPTWTGARTPTDGDSTDG